MFLNNYIVRRMTLSRRLVVVDVWRRGLRSMQFTGSATPPDVYLALAVML